LKIRNCSSAFELRDAFVSCSHPLMLNFENQLVFKSLAPGKDVDLPIQLRSSINGKNLIKFLIRYEVVGEPVQGPSRFRFQRLCLHLDTQ